MKRKGAVLDEASPAAPTMFSLISFERHHKGHLTYGYMGPVVDSNDYNSGFKIKGNSRICYVKSLQYCSQF